MARGLGLGVKKNMARPFDKRTVKVRFMSFVRHESDCWIWIGGISTNTKYGVFWLDGKSMAAHRVSYELYKGKIPTGLQIDHLCRNRACVNPDHLEPVTCKENLLRGETLNARTHCPKGHPRTEDNLRKGRRVSKGYVLRGCRLCHNEDSNKRYHKSKEVQS